MSATLIYVRDSAPNSNSKILVTVPKQTLIQIHYVEVVYTTEIAIGNRGVAVAMINSDSEIISQYTSIPTQSLGSTARYNCLPGVNRETSVNANAVFIPIPSEFWVLPTYSLRVFDRFNISNNDDMIVDVVYTEIPHNHKTSGR